MFCSEFRIILVWIKGIFFGIFEVMILKILEENLKNEHPIVPFFLNFILNFKSI